MTDHDTIFALSSGAGRAGIAVIRLSGKEAATALLALCGGVPPARRFCVKGVRGPTGELLDRGIVVWLPGPHTVTGEDMAEFHVHGSNAVVSAVLSALSALPGCRLAEAGEFTRRALINDKMDLVEVEGLSDLLAADTERQRRQAMYQMSGAASSAYDSWLKRMTQLIAHLEAAIDFVEEEGVAEEALGATRAETRELISELEEAVADSAKADLVRGGVRVAIIGPPNAGKSSLLNRLAKRDAAIVSATPGTTRDVLDVTLVLAGVPVILSDTAGLRQETEDGIEREGMSRALRAAELAHIVIVLSSPDTGSFSVEVGRAQRVKVLNKIDLQDSIQMRYESDLAISTLSGEGLDDLLDELERRVLQLFQNYEAPVVVRERHRQALQSSIRSLYESLTFAPEQIELAAEHVRLAARSLSAVTGRIEVEDVLGQIFAEFCVGK